MASPTCTLACVMQLMIWSERTLMTTVMTASHSSAPGIDSTHSSSSSSSSSIWGMGGWGGGLVVLMGSWGLITDRLGVSK